MKLNNEKYDRGVLFTLLNRNVWFVTEKKWLTNARDCISANRRATTCIGKTN